MSRRRLEVRNIRYSSTHSFFSVRSDRRLCALGELPGHGHHRRPHDGQEVLRLPNGGKECTRCRTQVRVSDLLLQWCRPKLTQRTRVLSKPSQSQMSRPGFINVSYGAPKKAPLKNINGKGGTSTPEIPGKFGGVHCTRVRVIQHNYGRCGRCVAVPSPPGGATVRRTPSATC